MNLGNPDARRGLRSVVQAVVVMAMIATVWANIERLDADGTKYILGWAMIVILVGTLGYILENGLRSIKASAWGASFDASTNDAPAAADAVAAAAVDKADEIKEAGQ